MTNVMPIFINSLLPFLTGATLDNQAKTCIEEARELVALAEKEINFGDIAFVQTNHNSEQPNKNLAAIAVWHYAESMKNYSSAVSKLERAGKSNLPAKYKKYVELKTKKCLEEMAYSNTRKIRLGLVLRTIN